MELLIQGEFYEANVTLGDLCRHSNLQVCAPTRFGDLQMHMDIARHYPRLYEDGRDLEWLSVVDKVNKDDEATGRFLLGPSKTISCSHHSDLN